MWPQRKKARICTDFAFPIISYHLRRMADLTHAKRNWNKTPGYTESETTAFAQILDPPASESSPSSSGSSSNNTNKFVDVWRRIHPDLRHYSYFSYRFNCRAKSLGWRLDMCKCYFHTTMLSSRIEHTIRLFYLKFDTLFHSRPQRTYPRERKAVRDQERDLWSV